MSCGPYLTVSSAGPIAFNASHHAQIVSIAALTEHDRGATPQAWHVAWSGSASKGQHIEVPAALAECLGIAQGIQVTAEPVSDVPEALGVCVEPISSDDWEVVEQNAGHMEDHILTQVSNIAIQVHLLECCQVSRAHLSAITGNHPQTALC